MRTCSAANSVNRLVRGPASIGVLEVDNAKVTLIVENEVGKDSQVDEPMLCAWQA